MPGKKGISLVEIIVALIILSISAAIIIPSYNDHVQQGEAIAAQNNLTSIYNAEKTYYLNNDAYCTTASGVCNSLVSINTKLALNIIDNNFNYSCTNAGNFQCTATNAGDNTFVLTVTNNPIVLPGGVGAANPSCTYPAHPFYCPN